MEKKAKKQKINAAFKPFVEAKKREKEIFVDFEH